MKYATAQTYVEMITKAGATIVHVNEMGLRQLAYNINNRTTGIYFCVEFQVETGVMIADLELALRRDERIMRFLTFGLDKYGVKYNEDKRAGKIGTVKKKPKKEDKRSQGRNDRGRGSRRDNSSRRDAPAKKSEAPAKKAEAPAKKVEAPAVATAPPPPAPVAKVISEEEE